MIITDFPDSQTIRKNRVYNHSVGDYSKQESGKTSGPKALRKLVIPSSISTNTFLERWNVFSPSGKRSVIVSYLFHKWLFAELSKEERILFFDLRESTIDPQIYLSLKANTSGISKKIIRKSLELFSFVIFRKQAPSLKKWIGYRTLPFSIEKERILRSQRYVKKYSGWRRHQNDHGSLGPPKEDPFYFDPFDQIDLTPYFIPICEGIMNGKSVFIINDIRITINE